jgi:uncharacterized damage-inducible protein DinB
MVFAVETLVDIKDLMEYNEIVRHRYFVALGKLSWKELAKNREASFHSLKNIFVHVLGATDYWLDFLQKQNLHSRKDYDKYTTFEAVRAYMECVERRMHEYLKSLTTETLHKPYVVKDDEGKTVKITAEDVLIHLFEEEIHHRGELNALLWQMGVDPPPMGWKGL